MTGFRVFPIDASIAEAVRETLKSPQYGHPAHMEPAAGYGPCRVCLQQFRLGEQRILFTYNPFQGLDNYPSPGPVFIHAEPCRPFAAISEWPQELRGLPLTLEAYGPDRWIIARERPGSHAIEDAVDRLMSEPGVRYIHIRNTEAGCFIARLERWEADHGAGI
jgi:hypothetical protein